ncbi:MAG: response regulator [Candidatus Dormibacteria bacterium]
MRTPSGRLPWTNDEWRTILPYALLIDDDIALCESLKRTATLQDLELLTASNWSDGLSLFQVRSPDLVIADYNLPESRNGLHLLLEMKRLRPSVRVILLSGYIDVADISTVERLQIIDRALSKSASPNLIGELMTEIADAKKLSEASTDWRAFAAAHQVTDTFPEREFLELDRTLKDRVQ